MVIRAPDVAGNCSKLLIPASSDDARVTRVFLWSNEHTAQLAWWMDWDRRDGLGLAVWHICRLVKSRRR